MNVDYRLPYVIRIDISVYPTNDRKKIWQWCKRTFGDDYSIWSYDSNHNILDEFYFKDDAHANLFLLRWG